MEGAEGRMTEGCTLSWKQVVPRQPSAASGRTNPSRQRIAAASAGAFVLAQPGMNPKPLPANKPLPAACLGLLQLCWA